VQGKCNKMVTSATLLSRHLSSADSETR